MKMGLFDIFASSPFKPLQEHMGIVHEQVSLLPVFFKAAFDQDWQAATRLQQKVSRLENDADDKKQAIRLQLPNSVFMPVSRSDLLQLLKKQDDIANVSKDICGSVIGRQLKFPENAQADYLAFLGRCLDAVSLAYKMVNTFDELLESGFRGQEASVIEEMIVKLDDIEDDTDQLQIKLRQQLYLQEDRLSPIEAIFLYKMIERTGKIADNAQEVGHCIQLLLAR